MWERALAWIHEKVNQQAFDAWFRPISEKSVDGDTLTLKVPNKFFKDWLVNNYTDLIEEAVFLEAGKRMKVDLLVEENGAVDLSREAPRVKELSSVVNGNDDSQLNPRYTFNNFVVGSSNQFPHAAAVAVSKSIGQKYNPFFVYGGVGLGKTHLIHAIGNAIRQNRPAARIRYISSEQFMNEFVWSLRNDRSDGFSKDNKMDLFRRRFRYETDVLLMDDIQFMAGKDRTQDEFFHTFNSLYERNKQIVLASDKYPQEIPDLEERLCSRFQWGLVADIQPPEFETRLAIVKKKAEEEGIVLPDEVATFLASSIKSNVRELEGSLINLAAHASLDGRRIDIAFATETLNKIIALQQVSLTVENIQDTVCKAFSVSLNELKGSGRKRSIVFPRQIAMYLCRKGLGTSLPELGERFGGRDHTTALAACRKIEQMIDSDLNVRSRVEALQRLLGF